MYKYRVGESTNGCNVYVNLITSAAGQNISRQPYLLNLLKEVIAATTLEEERMVFQRDMGRNIGHTNIVETAETDTVFYAQPAKKSHYSRFVKNKTFLQSKYLTLVLERDEAGGYEVVDTWIGPCSPPFPGEERETINSKAYWANHALILDSQVVQQKSITKICPY
jgi:hypothetical protein